MGQGRSRSFNEASTSSSSVRKVDNINNERLTSSEGFYDLKEFPPEIAVSILSNLNATDLCLASCVWKDLAEDEILWKELCLSRWAYTTIYAKLQCSIPSRLKNKPIYKSIYLLLDEATLIFGFRPHQGIKYLIDHNVLENTSIEIAKFIQGTSTLSSKSLQNFLKDRPDIMDELTTHMNFNGTSICDGLRKYFQKIHPPEQRGTFLDLLVEKFALRFTQCNPNCEFDRENIGVLCYSLLLLSVDLYSPHVKNKMSKREFIRNSRQVLGGDANRDLLGDIYDDIYLNGHIVPNCKQIGTSKKQPMFPFYRPYGAIFEFKPIQIKLNCAC